MIGLALVTLVTMLAAGIISSFKGSVNEIWKNADYAITAQNNFSPIPVAVAQAAAKAPGVEAIASTRTGEARVFDKTEFVTAVDPQADQVLTLKWTEGSQKTLSTLGADGASASARTVWPLMPSSSVNVLPPSVLRQKLVCGDQIVSGSCPST